MYDGNRPATSSSAAKGSSEVMASRTHVGVLDLICDGASEPSDHRAVTRKPVVRCIGSCPISTGVIARTSARLGCLNRLHSAIGKRFEPLLEVVVVLDNRAGFRG